MLGYEWKPFTMEWSDLAAWVQAFGSIAAIVAAYKVANYQWTMARQDRAEEKAERLLQLKAVSDSCASLFEIAATSMTSKEASEADHVIREKFRILGNVARGIQFHEVPNELISDLVLQLVISLDEAVSIMASSVLSQRHVPENTSTLNGYSEKLIASQRLSLHLSRNLQEQSNLVRRP